MFISNVILFTCIFRIIYEKTNGQVPLGPILGKQNIQAKEVFCTMTSFYYNHENPSVWCFLCKLRLLKCRHRKNGLLMAIFLLVILILLAYDLWLILDNLTNLHQFSMFCTTDLIGHRIFYVKLFNTRVESRAVGEGCNTEKVLNIMTSFLWSIRLQTTDNCRFVLQCI